MRRLVGAGLALATLALSAGTAEARPVYGVQGIGTGTRGGALPDLDLARKLSTRITRIEASWAELEPSRPGAAPNATALAALDRTIDAAARRRIKVVLFVDQTPCWASSAPQELRKGCTSTNRNRSEVTRWQPTRPEESVPISQFLVARYGAKLAAFEVWNEPDQANEKYWAGPKKVENYVALVKALYAPLKQANPTLPVLAGSFVGIDGRWLEAMYKAGVKGYYDALAVHFYNLPLYGLATTRALQKRYGDATPMWLTEFGWNSCHRRNGPRVEFGHPCVTRSGQAQNLIDVSRALRTVGWVKAMIQFQVADQPRSFKFGLLDTARRPKPAYRAAQRLQRGVRLRATRPTVRLSRSGNRLIAQGIASGADALHVRVYQGSTLRLRALLTTDRFRRWRIVLPAVLGTRGLRVTVRGGMLKTSAQARV